jgi:amino acid transporter
MERQAVERTTSFALEQRSRLKKVLSTRDLVLFTTSGIIGIDTMPQSASYGVQTIFWVIVSCVLFAIPYAFIAAELGTTYVKNGGLYVWIKEAFNPYIASLATFLYWISNPIWMASLAVEAVGILQSMIGATWSTGTRWWVCLLLIWLVALLEVSYLNVGKWLPNIGAVIKFALLLAIGLIGIAIAIHRGHPANSFALANWMPTKAVAVAYLPVLMYQWQGFELQSNAAQEMTNPQRGVRIAIIWSVVLSAVGYTMGVLGMLLVIPLKNMSNVSALFDTFKAIIPHSPLLPFIGILIIIGLLASGTTWLLGVDRAFAASGYDGNIPQFFGHYNKKFGTPDLIAILGAIVSSLILTLKLFVGSGTSGLGEVYQLLLYMAILAGTAPYLLMFPALLIFRKRCPKVHRPFSVPGGAFGAWFCVIMGLIWVIPTFIFAFLPNGLSSKWSDVEQSILGTVIALVIATILFIAATKQRRNLVKVSLVDQDDEIVN